MSDDLRELLRATARTPGAGPDVDRLWAGGRRRRRMLMVAGFAGAVALVTVAAAALLPFLRPASPVVLAPAPTHEPVASPTDELGPPCEAPPYRPTYLPWLKDGETAREPDARHGGSPEEPSVVLYWAEDPEAFHDEFPAYSGTAVTVATNAELGREPGSEGHAQVQVRGHDGELAWLGDPGIGGVSVTWRERPDPCGAYSVAFTMTRGMLDHIELDPDRPGFDEAEGEEVDDLMRDLQQAIEAELLRVVESLQPVDPG